MAQMGRKRVMKLACLLDVSAKKNGPGAIWGRAAGASKVGRQRKQQPPAVVLCKSI